MKKRILVSIIFGMLSASAYAATLSVVSLPTNQKNAIAGHYSSTFGYVHVKPQQQGFFTSFNGKRVTGVKKSDGFYYSTFRLIGLIPISLRMSLDKVDKLHRVTWDRPNNKKVIAQQFKATPITPEWRSRLGSYRVKAINGKSKITNVKFEAQNGVFLIRMNNGKYAYPLIEKTANKLVRPTIGRPKQRTIEVWPAGKSLAAVIGNIRFRLDKI